MNIKIRLHHLTFIAFTVISSVPVFFLAAWVQQSAMNKEVKAVAEKHLLVANNVTRALSRYIQDVESGFRLVVSNLLHKEDVNGLPKLLENLNFLHVCLINPNGQVLDVISGSSNKPPQQIPLSVLSKLTEYIEQSKQTPNQVVFSQLVRDDKNIPRIFVVQTLSEQQIVLGILTTSYIQKVQKSIAFGVRGHAAIVDGQGKVMAHPSQAWQDDMKDISQIGPVKLMMQGNTGVTQFYSPPMQADMIAGYTSVPQTGWGVMVPQPMEELSKRAQDVRFIALTITILGISIAGIISWFLAGFMTRPIQAVVNSALITPKDNQLRTVNYSQRFLPQEFQELITAFNHMINDIHVSNTAIEETASRLEEAQRIANLGNWEWDIESDKLWCSEEFYRICHIPATQFNGHYTSLLELIHPDDQELFKSSIEKLRLKNEHFSIDHRIVLANHKERFVHHEAKSICRENEQIHIVGIIHDITERKQHENQLFHQANFDQLTSLPNRTLFFDRLSQSLINSARENHNIALLFIDLDNFKDVNDSYGHIVGDRLLQQAAERLVKCVRKGDTVARLGGDEFTIILNNISQGEDAAIIANKAISKLVEPFQIENYEAFISASIGITISPIDANTSVALLRNADIALYRAKAAGRNTFCFYTTAMDEEVINRTRLGNELRKAVEQNELSLYFQPIIDLQTGKITSAEALLRWIHPTRGFIPPDVFIPIAEETGIIAPLGKWVLQNACKEANTWQEKISNAPSVSVNLSVQQLKLGLSSKDIKNILKQTKLCPKNLTLEITESMFMDDVNETIRWMKQINNLGVDFSVDDFGTGYSSLSYLKRLPVKILKIDRTFVIDSTKKTDDAMLVRSIIAIGKSLNLQVVAEGVEEENQVKYLKRLRCDYVQGYYYSKPLPKNDFFILLQNWHEMDRDDEHLTAQSA